MRVLLIHPNLNLWAGGEYIALKVIEALQKDNNEVLLATEPFDSKGTEAWNGQETLQNIRIVELRTPHFKRARSIQRLVYLNEFRRKVRDVSPDRILNTQLSTYHLPGVSFAYHPGDLAWFFRDGNLFNIREIYYRLIRGMLA